MARVEAAPEASAAPREEEPTPTPVRKKALRGEAAAAAATAAGERAAAAGAARPPSAAARAKAASAEVRRQLKERLASRRVAAAHLDGVEVSAPPPTVEPERPLRKVAYMVPPQTALPLDVLTLGARKDAHLATLIAVEGRRGGDGDHESVVTFT